MMVWDDTFAIARALIGEHPDVDFATVSLEKIFHWVIALPDFDDDPALANDEILQAIIQEWFEEENPI